MKQQIIVDIQNLMQQILNNEQQQMLKIVLEKVLNKYQIVTNKKDSCYIKNEELLNSFIAAKKIEGCSEKSLIYYQNTISRAVKYIDKSICNITTIDLRNYLSNYQETNKVSKITLDNVRRIFSSFFSWLEDEELILKSPVRRIHKVRAASLVKETYSDESIEHMRNACANLRDRALIEFLASTGIRVGELVRLNRNDINFQERTCIVFGKGEKEREIYFDARCKIYLQKYLFSRNDTNPALFVSKNAPFGRLGISGIEVFLRKLGGKLGINKVHPHKFRRTLATMAIDKGMPIEQVQKLLGHQKIDTTLHYAMVKQQNVKLAHRKYIG